MFHRLEDFFKAYEYRAASTAKILGRLTDANLGQRVAPNHRALNEIAWHVVTSIPEMMSRTGLSLSSVAPGSPPPMRAAAIQEAYGKATEELAAAVRRDWTDATLAQADDMYGEKWPRGLTLAILIHHEIHHLGQMTVLLRQAGQTVPGTFGPSQEEWTAYGMQPPAY